MNPQLIYQLATHHTAELYQRATRSQLAAAGREPRESVRQRAGWALIKAGLKLAGPPSPRRGPRPRPAGL